MDYPAVLLSLFVILLISTDSVESLYPFHRVFSFGDSMADTGNACRSMGAQNCPALKPPFGETYFHQPNGRWSDGRVVADFIGVASIISSSLFIVGEIGGVEYLFGFSKKKSVDEMKSWVPYIVAAISSAVNDLINLAATTLIVPGGYAVGCAPGYMTMFQSNNPADYDMLTGCLKRLNEFTVYHNTMLMKELVKLRLLHPLANIIYADYYGAQSQLYLNKLDFPAPLYACCGGPGPYNSSLQCGSQGSQTCSNPENYISWDGGHLTEAANKAIANGILYGPFAFPPL
ncbi:hypothetical protein LUZ61_012739 [Rhynchospora tenuis]|uniref:GDSL esterase/lipase n=1 Tax=Rhynchospora tenuis TaxID=198213 RepID=A0AAD6A3P5_9POAL|nr:hypothetical protein LUZ61_012739 [Rhynchospora tenuis]